MFGFVSKRKYDEVLDQLADFSRARSVVYGRLESLRANCFLTNEKGHRVRYVNASAEVQAKAEGRENGK